MRLALLTLVALAWLMPIAASADAPPGLRHNPFSRPPVAARSGVNQPGAPAALDPTTLPLRGTLNAGAESLANVGGELLSVGDEYQGWRLVAIGEGEAEFASGKQHITVPVAGTEKGKQDVRKPRN